MTVGANDEVKLDGQQQEGQQVDASPAEPEDLAQAFKAYREQNASMAGDSVPAGEPAAEGDLGGEGEPGDSTGTVEPGARAEGDLGLSGGQGDLGGPSAAAADVDFSSYGKTLDDEISRAAIQAAQRRFAEQKISKISISQLYQRDERTGSVSFLNPDDPNRPFSSRAEAQAWCNAFNQDVDAEFRKAATAERDKLAKQYKPTMDLIRFAPKFEKFDDLKKSVINDIIEDYAIKQGGRTIGYSCDLDAVAARADKLIARFKPAQPAQAAEPAQQEPKGTEPALDMRGSGSGTSGSPKEPKDLAEALRMVQQGKKAKK